MKVITTCSGKWPNQIRKQTTVASPLFNFPILYLSAPSPHREESNMNTHRLENKHNQDTKGAQLHSLYLFYLPLPFRFTHTFPFTRTEHNAHAQSTKVQHSLSLYPNAHLPL